MTTLDDLLQAILAAPHDDALRLIYADKLDDSDEPALAEFVRVQVKLASSLCHQPADEDEIVPRTPNSMYCNDSECRRCTLDRLAAKLFAYNGDGWFRNINDLFGDDVLLSCVALSSDDIPNYRCCVSVSRGFISDLTCSWADFAAHSEAILRIAPIERVTLTTMPEWGHQIGTEGNSVYWLDGEAEPVIYSAAELDAWEPVEDSLLRLRWPTIAFTLPESAHA